MGNTQSMITKLQSNKYILEKGVQSIQSFTKYIYLKYLCFINRSIFRSIYIQSIQSTK